MNIAKKLAHSTAARFRLLRRRATNWEWDEHQAARRKAFSGGVNDVSQGGNIRRGRGGATGQKNFGRKKCSRERNGDAPGAGYGGDAPANGGDAPGAIKYADDQIHPKTTRSHIPSTTPKPLRIPHQPIIQTAGMESFFQKRSKNATDHEQQCQCRENSRIL